MGCATSAKKSPATGFTAENLPATVNGLAAVKLTAPVADPSLPQIVSVTLLPGRGMNVFQVQGYLPGKGVIDLFKAQALQPGENSLGTASEDVNGNLAFTEGGALLVPYANRIRGKLSKDGQTLETQIAGHKTKLPANWKGKKPGAEKHAMHGLILNAQIKDVQLESGADQARAHGTLDAGDFGGHWPSHTKLEFNFVLRANQLDFTVTAQNAGKAKLPLGIGWHPYFVFPSGDRKQARLHVPAKTRLLVNNYDDVFPTGKHEKMEGTRYDFGRAGGKSLEDLYLDDCFVDLARGPEGQATAEIIDPAAQYGMRVTAVSPQVTAFQAYAPPDKSFVALEPQFNWGDPYSHQTWKHGEKTGMVTLKPGESTRYEIQLQLFKP